MQLFGRLALALALSAMPFFGGCAAVDSDVDAPAEDAAEGRAGLAVPFEVVPFTKSDAPAGLTVIKSKAQFKAFFGFSAPSNLSFQTTWVVHHSLGVKGTGGYAAEITGVERTGSGPSKLLTVATRTTSPGPACFVTQALTNPQVSVKIPRQAAQIPVAEVNEAVEKDCSEPNWCAAALCAEGSFCDESIDSCVATTFCMVAKCANGYTCSDEEQACVPRPCDPNDAASCPDGFTCHNQIACITAPCPEDFRCIEQQVGPCGDVTYEGLCTADDTLQYCENDELIVVPCGSATCSWSSQNNYFDCL
jgi:hypothetical protein